MPNYTFDKQQVLDTLIKNRQEHRLIFEEALEGYKTFAIAEFNKRIAAVKKGEIVHYVSLTQPSDHTKDYDRIISLMGMALGDTIELNEEQYGNYILDDWDWQKQSLTANSYYSSTAKQKLAEDDDE